MKLFFIVGSIIGALIILATIILAYHDFFKKVVITEEEIAPMTFAYLKHKGSYYKIGSVMDSVYSTLKKQNVETAVGIGIYYDPPSKVRQDDLRSIAGCILSEKDKRDVTSALSIASTDRMKAIVARVKIKSKFSYMIHPMIVYPALEKYINEKKYQHAPSIELYDETKKESTYIIPLDLPPETLEQIYTK